MNGYIYKITNQVNGKIYIGQTRKAIDVRFKEHLKEAFSLNTQRPLYKAMRKYGMDKFKLECVEEVPILELDDKECFYIKLYDCLAIKGNGYNISYGGGGKKVDYDLIQQLWDSGLSMTEICQRSKYGRDAVRAALTSYPKYSKDEARRRGIAYQNVHRKRRVYQYSPDGDYIAEYRDADFAAASLNCKVGTLRAALESPGYLGNGYQWSYYKFDHVAPISHKARVYRQRVLEMGITGEVIAAYESAESAAQLLNVPSSYIRQACNSKTHRCVKLGRYFKYEHEKEVM